ncbi:rho guanine nucleotide exchange factor 8-like [Phoenix dactylifera]|uniref:Rho guanine nucleotide exchange factor 8-like n=1 Tax=Phoenix dactylifera TaxID=42345 RepID=A0A8B7BG94_PHODC|nr:rho guanine nucleotide exchange factor 8-like [Phoenix dactylifera]
MVRFLKRGPSLDKPVQGREQTCEISGRQAQSLILEGAGGSEENAIFRSQGETLGRRPVDGQQIGWALDRSSGNAPKSHLRNGGMPSDMELMKERFAKLLLGEDMSGGGKGVSSALALSNAITNLAASVFGEQRRLEPMSAERKARWHREIDWLLSVTDHIVEFVPSKQISKDGSHMEIMVTQERRDLYFNIPALRKLDAMLIGYLDNFKDQDEFWYVSRDADESEKGNTGRKDDKWWLPTVKVPPNGLSEVTTRWLVYQKESVNQVLKAAMAINAQVLTEMEVPEVHIESLPKNGRSSLGDAIYKSITVEVFNPEEFLASMDLATEHGVLDLKNRIEASIIIWKRKMHNKDGKSSWGSTISSEKREQFEERAETILHLIKQRFPGIPQSALDISKIQYNRDFGQAVLESYSRVLESLAFTVMSQIEDVLYADSVARDPSHKDSNRKHSWSDSDTTGMVKKLDPKEELEKLKEAPTSMTLSDFMGWHFDPDAEAEKKDSGSLRENMEKLKKPPNTGAKKFSYREKLEILGGLRSPTARH